MNNPQHPFQDHVQRSCSIDPGSLYDTPRLGCPMNSRVVESLGYNPDALVAASMEGFPYRKFGGGNFAVEELGQATLETKGGPVQFPVGENRILVQKPDDIQAEQRNPWGPYRCRDTFDCSGKRQCYIWNNDVAGVCVDSCSQPPFKSPYMSVGPYNVAPPMARYTLSATPTQLANFACQVPSL